MPEVPPAGLYVHYPYCISKCVYCDFNSFVSAPAQERYLEAVLAEIRLREPVYQGIPFDTLFFGGGTPSLWKPGCIEGIIEFAGRHLGCATGAEITIEVNPGTVDLAGLEAILKAGVNRLSVGVQSMNDAELKNLGRIHDAKSVARTLGAARKAGFSNIGADLIFGIPGQTTDALLDSLGKVISEGVSHISMYALTLAKGTPLERMVKEGLELPDDEITACMYAEARGFLAEKGFGHYEISNWAIPGMECRHNVSCWEGGYYLGAGAGAHGHHPGIRYSNCGDPEAYMEGLAAGNIPYGESETVDSAARAMELVCLGLRMMKGLNPDEAGELMGEKAFERMKEAASRLSEAGLLKTGNGRYTLTEYGELFADRVATELLS